MMTRLVVAVLACASLAPASGGQTPETAPLLNRMSTAYRSCRSYRSTSSWSRSVNGATLSATVTLAAERPNRYVLEIAGSSAATTVWSDGSNLTAFRPGGKVFVRSHMPDFLVKANILKGIDIPSAAACLVTMLLQGGLRDPSSDLGRRMLSAEFVTPAGGGGRDFYTLRFSYDLEHEARIVVGAADALIRRVTLVSRGKVFSTEEFSSVEIEKDLPADTFRRSLPDGLRPVSVLPPADLPVEDEGISLKTIAGGAVQLNELKGKVVLLGFFFTTCGPCNAEMPRLVELNEKLGPAGLSIVLVNGTGEGTAEIKSWADGHGITFPVTTNRSPSDVVRQFRVTAYPTSIVFDRQGKVVGKVVGLDEEGVASLIRKAGLPL